MVVPTLPPAYKLAVHRLLAPTVVAHQYNIAGANWIIVTTSHLNARVRDHFLLFATHALRNPINPRAARFG